jgi:hypothetical protein
MRTNLLIGGIFALCVAACATSPAVPESKLTAREAEPPAGCVADAATRIPGKPGECGAFGHTWTSQDVKTTGATDVAQALRQLDPTVIVSH